jgi:SHS2 domain-containing protein
MIDEGNPESTTAGWYETFDHTADLGVVIRAATGEELYCRAARLLAHLLTGRLEVPLRQQVTISLISSGPEELLVDFLREVLYLFTRDKFLVGACRMLLLKDTQLEAILAGDIGEPDEERACREIKAVTYHLLEVVKSGEGWRARVVFDV